MGGREKVIQYWSCHSVNLINDYAVFYDKKYQQPNKLQCLSFKICSLFSNKSVEVIMNIVKTKLYPGDPSN